MPDGPSSARGSGQGRLIYVAAITCSFGGLLFGYDTGIIPGTMLPELFPSGIRGSAQGASAMFNWGANFGVSLVFPVLLTSIGEGPVFLIFAAIGVASFVFVGRLVPETKGESLEQIEAELRGGRSRPN